MFYYHAYLFWLSLSFVNSNGIWAFRGVACIWLGNLLLRPLKVFNPQSLVLASRRHQAFSRLRLSLRLRCSFCIVYLKNKDLVLSLCIISWSKSYMVPRRVSYRCKGPLVVCIIDRQQWPE